jgi:hypothetical protein
VAWTRLGIGGGCHVESHGVDPRSIAISTWLCGG